MSAIPGEYDDDRSLTIESSFNGEVAVKIGNQEPIFVFAEPFLTLASTAAREALAAFPYAVGAKVQWNPTADVWISGTALAVNESSMTIALDENDQRLLVDIRQVRPVSHLTQAAATEDTSCPSA